VPPVRLPKQDNLQMLLLIRCIWQCSMMSFLSLDGGSRFTVFLGAQWITSTI